MFFDWLKKFFDFCGKFFLLKKFFFDGFPDLGALIIRIGFFKGVYKGSTRDL